MLLVTAFLVITQQSLPFRPLYGPLILLPVALLASGLLRALWSLRHRTGIGLGRALLALFNWLSLSWTVAIASLQGLFRSKAVFMRTPKERGRQTVWTALRDARAETVLALLMWGCGIGVAVVGGGPVFLVALFAWQGMVYASAPLMSYLNVRSVLTPELERRRRTELRRERAAALAPFLGGAFATAAAALIAAVLFLGGSEPGQPPGGLNLPRQPDRPGIFAPVDDPPASTPEQESPEPSDPESEPTGSPEPDEPAPTEPAPTEPAPTDQPTEEPTPTGTP